MSPITHIFSSIETFHGQCGDSFRTARPTYAATRVSRALSNRRSLLYLAYLRQPICVREIDSREQVRAFVRIARGRRGSRRILLSKRHPSGERCIKRFIEPPLDHRDIVMVSLSSASARAVQWHATISTTARSRGYVWRDSSCAIAGEHWWNFYKFGQPVFNRAKCWSVMSETRFEFKHHYETVDSMANRPCFMEIVSNSILHLLSLETIKMNL